MSDKKGILDKRPNRFLALAVVAVGAGLAFVSVDMPSGAEVIGAIFGLYMVGEGLGWMIEHS